MLTALIPMLLRYLAANLLVIPLAQDTGMTESSEVILRRSNISSLFIFLRISKGTFSELRK